MTNHTLLDLLNLLPSAYSYNRLISDHNKYMTQLIMRFSVFLILFLVTAVPAQSSAQAETEKQISELNISSNTDPAIYIENSVSAYNPVSNEFLVVWHEKQATGNYADSPEVILGLRIGGSDGQPKGTEFIIGNGNFPSIAYDSAGNRFLIVWADNSQTLGTIRAALFDGSTLTPIKNGISLGSGFSQNIATLFTRTLHSKVIYNNRNGEYFVVWEGAAIFGDRDYQYNIFGAKISAEGVAGTSRQISTFRSGISALERSSYPVVAFNSINNQYFVAWSLVGDANSFFARYGQLLDASTLNSLSEQNVNLVGGKLVNSHGGEHSIGQIDMTYNSANNEYALVYGGQTISLERFNNNLQLLGSIYINNSSGDHSDDAVAASLPAIIYLPANNHYLVSWQGSKKKYPESKLLYPHGQLVDASTGALSGVYNFKISDAAGNYLPLKYRPSTALGPNNNLLTAYFHLKRPASGLIRDVHASVFRPYFIAPQSPLPPEVTPETFTVKLSAIKKRTSGYKMFEASCVNEAETVTDRFLKVYYSQNKFLEYELDVLKKSSKLQKKKRSIKIKVKRQKKTAPKFLIAACGVSKDSMQAMAIKKIGKIP